MTRKAKTALGSQYSRIEKRPIRNNYIVELKNIIPINKSHRDDINKSHRDDIKKLYGSEDAKIRYSLSTDSEGNNLTQNQVQFFGNSQERDDSGALNVMMIFLAPDAMQEMQAKKFCRFGE